MKMILANMNTVAIKDLTQIASDRCSSRREEALIMLGRAAREKSEPRYLGCYGPSVRPPAYAAPGLRLLPGLAAPKARSEQRRREAAHTSGETFSLTLPAAQGSFAEGIAFWVVAVSGLAGIAYSFGMISWLGANWEFFNAWVTGVLR
jgi:hypothetical protein